MSMPPPSPTPRGPSTAAGPPVAVPTKRNTRIYLLLAILVAAVAMFFVLTVLGGVAPKTVWVYKAKENITSQILLQENLFEPAEISEETLVEGAYRAATAEDLKEEVNFENLVTRYPIPKGAQLTVDAAGAIEEVNTDLAPDQRLVAVEARLANAAGGIIRPGDKVDLFAAADLGGDGEGRVVQMVLADVEVVAVTLSSEALEAAAGRQASEAAPDGEPGGKGEYFPSDPIPGVYLLKVLTSQVPRVVSTNEWTKLYVAYRGPNSTTEILYPGTLLETMCGFPGVPAGVDLPPLDITLLPAVCLSGG